MVTSDDPPVKPFVFGTKYGPNELDPQDARDSYSIDVIDQVCEGLFAYNLTDPELVIIPNLALSGTYDASFTKFTVILRQGVTFHDGAIFNADAVNFTWTRMSWALNTTGLNTDKVTQVAELYEFPDGTPIVSNVTKNGDYNITFNLAAPFLPFKALLCFSASYILSPLSTPATAYIDKVTGDLVGTGPFFYDTYNIGANVTFHAYENYWQGKASIEEMIFKIIPDCIERNDALLSKEIHFLSNPIPEYFDNITSDPDLAFLDQGKTGAEIRYLGMNNELINTTIREAISYAINYSYIIDVMKEGSVERLKSLIPLGITHANSTFDVPILNLSYARQVMQLMGFGIGWNATPGSSDESNWQTATFLTYNYTYNIGNNFREDLLVLLQDNLGKIGIVVEDAGTLFWEYIYIYIYILYEMDGFHRNMLQLYWINWCPDYNDPSNFINPLFTNRSIASNFAQYDGYEAAKEAGRNPLAMNDNVQLLMEAALSEGDPVAREAMYDRIQELFIEHDRPLAWGYVNKLYDASNIALSGFQQNAFKKMNFYSCQWNWNYNYSMDITHPQDINYIEGSVGNTITWNITAIDTYNTTYTIYINDILNQTGSWDVGVPIVVNIDGLSEGIYEYRIEAHSGSTIEDDIVIVTVISEDPVIHGFDVFVVSFTVLIGIGFISWQAKKKNKK